MCPQTWSLLNLVRCSTLLKIMKQRSRWSSRAEVRQRDTYPGTTELRLLVIWQNQRGPQNPNQICWHRKPTRRHTDQGQFHLWWVEKSSPSVQYQRFQLCQLLRSDVKKNAKRNRRRIVAKSKPTLNLVSHTAASSSTAPSSSASNCPAILRAPSQLWVFKNVQGNLPLKIPTSTTRTTRSGRTITAYLVPTFHTWRKSTRTCGNNLNERQTGGPRYTMIWRTDMLVTQQVADHLGNHYLQNLRLTKNQSRRTMKQIVRCNQEVGQWTDRNSWNIPDQLTRQILGKDSWTTQQFSCQQRKSTYSPIQYYAWEEFLIFP